MARPLAFLAGVFLLYAPSLNAPVIYDDAAHVRDNPVFRLPFAEFWRGLLSRDYFSFAAERTYQPLVTLFHYATHSYPLVYRAAGLGLHALNAFLLYAIAKRFVGRGTALLAGLLFAAFPAHTELLNFSAFKGHLFAATCSLAVLLCVMEPKKKYSPPLACGWLVLGLLCKETALAAVVLAALSLGLFARAQARRFWGLAAIAAAYLWYRFAYLAPPPVFPRRFEYSSLESFAFYLRTLAAPYPLCLERTLPGGPWWTLWLAAFAAGLWCARRSKEALFSLLWIAATALPFLHLISFSNVSPVADRYLYLPAAGFCLLLARLLRERALTAVLVAWSVIAFARNTTYRSTRALFEQTASCAPDNPRAQFLLGMICFQEKDYAASRAAYTRVLALTDSRGARAALADIDRAEATESASRRRDGVPGANAGRRAGF